jgi:hypothetical protein
MLPKRKTFEYVDLTCCQYNPPARNIYSHLEGVPPLLPSKILGSKRFLVPK